MKNVNTGPVQATRITAPADGTILALDPDIPPARQRVRFTADAPGARWLLDGKPLGSGPTVQWLPWPGRHRVALVDAGGQTLDEIRLEVRGAGVEAVGLANNFKPRRAAFMHAGRSAAATMRTAPRTPNTDHRRPP